VIPVSLIPNGSNNDDKSRMDTDTSFPAVKEKHVAEKVKQANINISLWKDNDYLCKNFILHGIGDVLYDLYRLYTTAKQV